MDVRLIAATNKDLEQALADGTFREDLYYRLNVFTICVPPLRERKSDMLLLADHFVEKYARLHGRSIKRISTPAIDMLVSYHWPGNVRELENTIERAVLVADGDVIHGHHLSPTLQTAEASGTVVRGSLAEAVAASRATSSRTRSRPPGGTAPGPPGCSAPPSGSSTTRSDATGSTRAASVAERDVPAAAATGPATRLSRARERLPGQGFRRHGPSRCADGVCSLDPGEPTRGHGSCLLFRRRVTPARHPRGPIEAWPGERSWRRPAVAGARVITNYQEYRMSTRGILPLAGALIVTTLVGTLGAQAVALRDEPSARPPALAATYLSP